MRILLDTSIIVEIDRGNRNTIDLIKKLMVQRDDLVISTVTVAEILTGSYLRADTKEAVLKAKEVINQFIWKEIDGETAEIAAKLFSALIIDKKWDQIEYADILIAASAVSAGCDFVLTLNKKDFVLFQTLEKKVYTPEEFSRIKI